MSSEWPIVPLGDCVELLTGYPFKSADYSDEAGSVRLLRGDNIGQGQLRWDNVKRWPPEKLGGLDGYKLSELDVVLAMDRPWIPAGLKFAKIRMADLPALLVQRVARLRPNRSTTANYLHYVLASKEFSEYIQNVTTGTAVPHISAKQIRDYKFRLPDLKTQEQVGGFLAELDDRIALLRETNATLEAIAQALFKSWFVDFDPVHARARGEQPKGLSDAIAALFPDGFEESPLGLIPRSWKADSVGNAVECVGGGTPDTKNETFWQPEEHPWTTPKDLSSLSSPVLLQTERMLSTAGLAKVSSGLLPTGSLLMSSRAPVGYLAIAQMPVAVNQGYIAMLPGGKLTPLYMLFWCSQNMEKIKSHANGSTFMEISKKAFRPLHAVIPPADVIAEFQNIAGPLFDRLVENEQHAQTLTTLRDTLLPRLISGQLQLSQSEQNAGESA